MPNTEVETPATVNGQIMNRPKLLRNLKLGGRFQIEITMKRFRILQIWVENYRAEPKND